MLISMSLTAVCFTLDGPRNTRCCIGFDNPYGILRYYTGIIQQQRIMNNG